MEIVVGVACGADKVREEMSCLRNILAKERVS